MNKKNKRYFIVSVLFLSAICFSCGGGGGGGGFSGVFADIEEEVKLNDVTAAGMISSACLHGGYLYCASANKLYKKPVNKEYGWESTTYTNVAYVASSSTAVYIAVHNGSSITGVKNITTGADVPVSGTINTIFDNQSMSGSRNAYVSTSSGVYKLNGNGTATCGAPSNAKFAVRSGSNDVFSNDFITVNYSNSTTVYHKRDYEEKIQATEGVITGMQYYEFNDAAYILLATRNTNSTNDSIGYRAVKISDGTWIDTPQTNAAQFAGSGMSGLWVFPAPDGGYAIYAGCNSTDKKRMGMWAYYPDKSWNVD